MRIEKDKIKHFSVCFLVSLAGGIYGVLFGRAFLSVRKRETVWLRATIGAGMTCWPIRLESVSVMV